MARLRKPTPTLDTIFFTTPEQKVFRLLLSEPTTSFTPRVISSRLKGVRGLGGTEGIMRILNDLSTLGLVEFVDNQRGVRLNDENTCVQVLKTFTAICDLETLKKQLEPISTRGVLFGARALGRARSDSTYEMFIVTSDPDEVKKVAGKHPLGRAIEVTACTPDRFTTIERHEAPLHQKVSNGIVLWGTI